MRWQCRLSLQPSYDATRNFSCCGAPCLRIATSPYVALAQRLANV